MRIFIAINLPEDIASSIDAARADLKNRLPPDAIRWIHVDNIHLTLKFIGEVNQDAITNYDAALKKAAQAAQPFPIHIRGFGCFPSIKRPRVLWIGVHEPTGELEQLQARIEDNLEQLGVARENRPFKAHLTVGRIKHNISGSKLAALQQGLREADLGHVGTFEPLNVSLYRSVLRPTGAVHTRLAQAKIVP